MACPMSDHGAYIGRGTIPGKGSVRVFADDTNPDKIHALTGRDEWIYTNKARVTFTPQKKEGKA